MNELDSLTTILTESTAFIVENNDLKQRLAKAIELLRPLAEFGRPSLPHTKNFHDLEDDVCVATNSGLAITAGDCRAAAAFLASTEPAK